ncbi:bacteriophage abortive infection AbiH family protein [Cohnella abietis]|uniref:Bacteriophage abortive infection AbiH n=1 Tax=Cohnella abietis TaxID=2507935 RepID=A0A3T1DA43_9BACL|nr:bacteriophage abortive infection AbiH family protein [Cohnella abietis]BBI34943.1 hypothetical protein KCTCHS21_43420 [Cohnella abietis]
MNRLFILGNGFDVAHSLPTRYDNFRKYLLENYPDASKRTPSFNISSSTMPDGEEVFDDDEAVSFIMHVISNAEADANNWCDIETSLGHLDFSEFFDDISILFGDEEDDDDFYSDDYKRREDAASNFRMVTETIKDYFSEWINTIDISEVAPKPKLQNLISNGENHFINFNYTKVLEQVYNVKEVTHIHGIVNGDIILGHGVELTSNTDDEDEDYEDYDDSHFELDELHRSLKKPTEKIIRKNESFFNKLTNVNEIYSYGFSFSDVDLPYIRKIRESTDTTHVVWYLSRFGKAEEHEEYKTKIRKCGFKGTFDWFDI